MRKSASFKIALSRITANPAQSKEHANTFLEKLRQHHELDGWASIELVSVTSHHESLPPNETLFVYQVTVEDKKAYNIEKLKNSRRFETLEKLRQYYQRIHDNG